MNDLEKILLENLKDPLTFIDSDHIIRYMNENAKNHYKDGHALLNKSIFDCHNEESKAIILNIFDKMKGGLTEELITDNEKHRVYMRAVRDREGNLLGYFVRYEPPIKK